MEGRINKIPKPYDFECNLSEEYKDYSCFDEWGCATLWLNDRQRKKDEKNGIAPMSGGYPYPRITRVLGNKDVEFMKRKIIWAYEHGLSEVSSR